MEGHLLTSVARVDVTLVAGEMEEIMFLTKNYAIIWLDCRDVVQLKFTRYLTQ